MEEPVLERSRYVTLWQAHSPLQSRERSRWVQRRSKEAAWQLHAGQLLLRCPASNSGAASASVQQALQSMLRFMQGDGFLQGGGGIMILCCKRISSCKFQSFHFLAHFNASVNSLFPAEHERSDIHDTCSMPRPAIHKHRQAAMSSG